MKRTKRIIGLTGPTGAGKSTASQFFKEKGALVIDCDVLARQIVMPGKKALEEIIHFFGKNILSEDGSLDRKKLGSIVFSDEEKRLVLNQITHKYITEELMLLLKTAKDVAVIDAPLLFEAGLEALCDVVVVVIASDEVRKNRIMQRDEMADTEAAKRMGAQKPGAYYAEKADYLLENNADVESFILSCEKIWRMICEEA
ncbi:MAG: dephospho-CoA kinase [Clostridia bacterium]|nr:dephospho-CoA kinase [Clostridia bacterium]